MLNSLSKVVNEYPNHALADDALTEIGVYYLLWGASDYERARNYFEQVITRYPNGNAVDNALNWKAWSFMKQRDYKLALSAYIDLVRKVPTSRFATYAFSNFVKTAGAEDKGNSPLLEYFILSGKEEEVGSAQFNRRPVVFYGNRDGRLKNLDVNFEWSTKISKLAFYPDKRYAVFQAKDYRYIVWYAWHVDNDSLFFVAFNKHSKKKTQSKNFEKLQDSTILKQLNAVL